MNAPEIDVAKLIETATQALAEAGELARSGQEHFGAVNWADLHVVDVGYEQTLMHDAPPFVFVEIEEASPNAAGLQNFLYEKLAAAGFGKVEVRLEW